MKTIESICLIGNDAGKRSIVEINGTLVGLTPKSFLYLFKLAWERTLTDDGWIRADKIEVGHNQSRYLYRLRSELREQGLNTDNLIENDHAGCYRLNLSPLGIHFDTAQLSQFPDITISRHFSGESRESAEGLSGRNVS